MLLLSPFLPGEARGDGTTALRTRLRLEAAGARVRLVRSDPEAVRRALAGEWPDVLHAVHATWAAHALLDIGDLPALVFTTGGNDVHEDLALPTSPATEVLRRAQVTVSATPEELACARRLGTDPGARHLLVPRWRRTPHPRRSATNWRRRNGWRSAPGLAQELPHAR